MDLVSVRTARAIRSKKNLSTVRATSKINLCVYVKRYCVTTLLRYSILKFFFFPTSFLKIIFFIFYAFVVYEPAVQNFIFLACREHKTRKKNFFLIGGISLLLTVSLSQRSYTSLFQLVKLCVTILLQVW